MDIEKRLSNLENLVNHLSEKIDSYKFYFNADIAGNRQSISAITPYTETKTAYIGDTEVVFESVPQGNVSVFGLTSYQTERIADNLVISFDALDEVTTVSISIQ